jgi:hypothetical protein
MRLIKKHHDLGLLGALVLVLLLCLAPPTGAGASAAGMSQARSGAAGGGKPSAWVVYGRPKGGRVTIGRQIGWCPPNGEARDLPRFDRVRQVSTPNAVILTAFLVNRPSSRCLGVVRTVRRSVRIRGGGLHGRRLLDGSQFPPVQRWPK